MFKIKIVRDVPLYCDVKVKRQIIDSVGYVWEQGITDRPKTSEYIVELPVPSAAPEGPAKYHAELYWSCNPWQRWYPKVTIQQEASFNILPSENREKLDQLPSPEELNKLKDGVEGLQKQQQQLELQMNPEMAPAAEWR